MIEVKMSERDGVTVFRPCGRIDSSAAPLLKEHMDEAVQNGADRVLVDLTEVEYISSGGLRVMLAELKVLKRRDGQMALCGMRPNVLKIFKLAGFTSIFEIYDDEASARL